MQNNTPPSPIPLDALFDLSLIRLSCAKKAQDWGIRPVLCGVYLLLTFLEAVFFGPFSELFFGEYVIWRETFLDSFQNAVSVRGSGFD